MLQSKEIKRLAAEVGFDLCGVARCLEMADDEAFLQQWIKQGYHSSLSYMERNIDKRANVTKLVEGAKSVIVCALHYKNEFSEGYPADFNTKVASYATIRDYHDTIKQMLRTMYERRKEGTPELKGRIFVDSAPIFEKRYAVEAGLGWIGHQSLLVTPKFGTFVLLGEIVLCQECDTYDEPYKGVGCGECRRCVEACPNGAIECGHIDTRRCISRATIERESDACTDCHGWIFGCDECQSICPYNRRAPKASHPVTAPIFNPLSLTADLWAEMTPEEFQERFASTPLSRSSLDRIQRMCDKK